MMRRVLTLTLAGLVYFAAGNVGYAQSTTTSHINIGLGAGLGGPLFLPLAKGQTTTALVTAPVFLRLRREQVIFFELEFSLLVPFGTGLNLLFDIVRTERFRAHIIDPGIFVPWLKPVSVARVSNHRSLDLTAGFGVEYQPKPNFALTCDLRWFFPSPWRTALDYGNFAVPIFDEALAGAQLWVGILFRLR